MTVLELSLPAITSLIKRKPSKSGLRSRPGGWTPKEAALLGTMPDADAAARLGRTWVAVHARRKKLGIGILLQQR
jgi:hypothetical protein